MTMDSQANRWSRNSYSVPHNNVCDSRDSFEFNTLKIHARVGYPDVVPRDNYIHSATTEPTPFRSSANGQDMPRTTSSDVQAGTITRIQNNAYRFVDPAQGFAQHQVMPEASALGYVTVAAQDSFQAEPDEVSSVSAASHSGSNERNSWTNGWPLQHANVPAGDTSWSSSTASVSPTDTHMGSKLAYDAGSHANMHLSAHMVAATPHQHGMPGHGRAGSVDQRTGQLLGPMQGSQSIKEITAYCFDRGNGQYTRLIPADMLPPLQGVPAFEMMADASKMVVLQVPGGLDANGRSTNMEHVRLHQPFPLQSSSNGTTKVLQSQIDFIVAASPSRHLKKAKVYCDKWIHEGTCAFTQQGCKYKHEMPQDKLTQHSLGLFHGLPLWYKKHKAEMDRLEASESQEKKRMPSLLTHCSTKTPHAQLPHTVVQRPGSMRTVSPTTQGPSLASYAMASRATTSTTRHDQTMSLNPSLSPMAQQFQPLSAATTKKANCGVCGGRNPRIMSSWRQDTSPQSPRPSLSSTPLGFGPIGPPPRRRSLWPQAREPCHTAEKAKNRSSVPSGDSTSSSGESGASADASERTAKCA